MRLSDTTGYLSDHDPVAETQADVVFLVRKRDDITGDSERARGTSVRAGITERI